MNVLMGAKLSEYHTGYRRPLPMSWRIMRTRSPGYETGRDCAIARDGNDEYTKDVMEKAGITHLMLYMASCL